MKTSLASIVLCIGFALVTLLRAQESAPTLSIAEATRSAQLLLDQQKLPKEYFIRSISLVVSPGSPTNAQYEACFQPTIMERVRVGTERVPIKYQVIVVTMDGKATIQEREITRTKRINGTSDSTTGVINQ